MREQLIKALLAHAQGDIAKHKANIEVYLANPVGIGEHPQHLDEVNKLLAKIAEAKDKLEALEDFDG